MHIPGVRRLGSVASHAHRLTGAWETARAGSEWAVTVSLLPLLLAEPVRAHRPVVVIPGVSAGPMWCAPLRSFLTARGHAVHQPGLGAMKGTPSTVLSRLERQITALSDAEGPVDVIGWSIGGVFARQVALTRPETTNLLITLGAPVGGRWYSARPETADRAMPVPTTALMSCTDPYFAPRVCRQVPAAHGEDIEIPSSHLGMATHPTAFHVVVDRLGQPTGQWERYRPRLPFPARTPTREGAST